jgi:hypothetical protein
LDLRDDYRQHATPFVNARIQIAWAQVELGRFDDAFATLKLMVDHCDQHLVWIAQRAGF